MNWRDRDALRAPAGRERNLGAACQAIAARALWWAGLTLAGLAITGAVLLLQRPVYSAEAQISVAPWTGGIIGLRASAASLEEDCGSAAGLTRLIASRELARQAIKDLAIEDNSEFASAANRLGPSFRALVWLGILGDPARQSREDRILEAFQDRLRVSPSTRRSVLTVAFRSREPELAAGAANRMAELYVALGAGASKTLPCAARARIVSRALPPSAPLYPKTALLLLSGAAAIVMGLGAGMAIALPRLPLRKEDPVEQPRVLGGIPVFARSEDSPPPKPSPNPMPPAGVSGNDVPDLVTRILAALAPAQQGIRILVTSLEASGRASCLTGSLARRLAREGHAIVIGFDSPGGLEQGTIAAGNSRPPAPGNLLSGMISFAEAIRRDSASRLHFLPLGCKGEMNLREFAIALDALGATYDFIVLDAPPLAGSDAAKTFAAAADLAVLSVGSASESAIFNAEQNLIECGVREVLIACRASSAAHYLDGMVGPRTARPRKYSPP